MGSPYERYLISVNSKNNYGSLFDEKSLGGLVPDVKFRKTTVNPIREATIGGTLLRDDPTAIMVSRSNTFSGMLNAIQQRYLSKDGNVVNSPTEIVELSSGACYTNHTGIESIITVDDFLEDFPRNKEFFKFVRAVHKEIVLFIERAILCGDKIQTMMSSANEEEVQSINGQLRNIAPILRDFINQTLFEILSGSMTNLYGRVHPLSYPALKAQLENNLISISQFNERKMYGYHCRLYNIFI